MTFKAECAGFEYPFYILPEDKRASQLWEKELSDGAYDEWSKWFLGQYDLSGLQSKLQDSLAALSITGANIQITRENDNNLRMKILLDFANGLQGSYQYDFYRNEQYVVYTEAQLPLELQGKGYSKVVEKGIFDIVSSIEHYQSFRVFAQQIGSYTHARSGFYLDTETTDWQKFSRAVQSNLAKIENPSIALATKVRDILANPSPDAVWKLSNLEQSCLGKEEEKPHKAGYLLLKNINWNGIMPLERINALRGPALERFLQSHARIEEKQQSRKVKISKEIL